MNRLIVAAIIALLTVPAHADVFNYVCRVKGKSLPVKSPFENGVAAVFVA